MSYNTKRGKAPAKRASFKTTPVRPYSPPTNKTNPMQPAGISPNLPGLNMSNGNNSQGSATSPSAHNAHVRARTYAANNRNAKISQLQSHDNHIVDSNGKSGGANDIASNASGLGMINETGVARPGAKSLTHSNDSLRQSTYPGNKHMPSQSIAVLSGGLQSQEALERFRHELRDVIWTEANVLDSKAGYRMYIWKHMAKNIWLPTASDLPAKFKYESYKNERLPNEDEKSGGADRSSRVTNANIGHNRQESLSGAGAGVGDDNDAETSYNGEYITSEKLEMYLKRRETFGHFIEDPNTVVFMDPFVAQMKNVLTAYAIANHNRFPLVGVVQLCAVILTTTKKEADTFYLLQILTIIMREYYQNDEEAIKNETLLLVDILCTNDQELVNRLRAVNIDVIDLSMLTCTWVRSLFAQHFLLPFIKRVIDLVLLEGPSVLTAIVYGIFCLMKQDLCQCESDHSVFDMLSGIKLKEFLKQSQFINSVILKAQLLHGKSNNKFISQNRNIKSWTEMIKLPGDRYFRLKSGVGDERRTKKELKSVSKNGFDLFDKKLATEMGFESESDSDKEDNEIGLLKKNMKDAQEEITRLKGTIERFQSMHLDASQIGMLNASASLGHSPGFSVGAQNALGIHARISRNQNSVEFHEEGTNGVPSQLADPIDEENYGQDDPQRIMQALSQSNRSLDPSAYASMSSIRSGSQGTKTVAEMLHMSPDGSEIYLEPLVGGMPDDEHDNGMDSGSSAREIQCRTENWTHGWKQALASLDDVSITMQGWLCKMTASKWNTRGTFEKVQRRYFVLRGHYLTYFKTNHHQAPKGDKCISILGYTINPVQHPKSKFAFEVISPPKDRHAAAGGLYASNPSGAAVRTLSDVSGSMANGNKDRYIREKFIILPDCDRPESEHKQERNKWIKALRFASKGQSLWDPLVGVVAMPPAGPMGAVAMGPNVVRKAQSDVTGMQSRYANQPNGDSSNGNSPAV